MSSPNRAWKEVLQSLEAARDEWTAMEAVVHLELLLEARDMLIEEPRPPASGFRPRSVSRCIAAKVARALVRFGAGAGGEA
jgi:hypothetical protein